MEQSEIIFTPLLITENLLRDCRFLAWINERTAEPFYSRAYIEHHPRAYWDSSDVYSLSIHCKVNQHGNFYLHISRKGDSKEWYCYLVNGKWSDTFIHLRLLTYFSELQEIVWAITRCNLFPSEKAMKDYCKRLLNGIEQ